MTVSKLEEAYQRLHEQLLRGELDEEEFKAEVEQLRFEDAQGDRWKIGWYTGKWYRYDQGQWVQGTPEEQPAAVVPPGLAGSQPPVEHDDRQRSYTPCLVISVIVLLLAAAVTLILGWNPDQWGRRHEETPAIAEVTNTEAATTAPSATPRSTTVAAASPSSTSRVSASLSPSPSPTATRRRPTESPTASATPSRAAATVSSTPTATPSRTPGATPTARPAPSPARALSGSIYFPVYDPNPDRRTFDIHSYDLESGEREIAIGQASQPAISPNGKRIVFRSWDIGRRGLLVRELTDGNTWPWVTFHEAEHGRWSPDNQNITFSSQQQSDRQWRLYRTLGLDVLMVQRQGGDVFGRVPTWSPDGRIIYWECPMNNCGLYSIHTDGTNLSRLTGNENDTTPTVSPDGKQVVFMSTSGGDWDLYLVGSVAPAGGSLQEPRALTDNPARDGLPTWSPDGRWVAFVSDRGGAWAVWAVRPDGSNLQELFDLGGRLEGEIANIPPSEQHGWAWESIAWAP